MAFKVKVKMDMRKLKQVTRTMKKLAKTEVEWGWINGKAYKKSDILGRGGIPYAIVAIHNEFGAYVKNMKEKGKLVYIHPRPYFQQSTKQSAAYTKSQMSGLVKLVLIGGDYKSHLKMIGEGNVDAVKASVARQNMKALHPKTIGYKGHDEQWKDTGELMDNITSNVIYKRAGYGGGR